MTPTGYAPDYAGYEVAVVDPRQGSLMPPDWRLDNFLHDGDGFVSKKGSDYQAISLLDVDEDGENDNVGTYPIFDLKFVHRRNSGVIWLRSLPLEVGMKDIELRVLAEKVVSSLSGGSTLVIQLRGVDYVTNKERHYAAKIQRRAQATLAGKPAYLISADVSNVDTLKVDPSSVDARLTFVLTRTGATHQYPRGGDRRFPLVLVLAVCSSPADVATTEPAFFALLSRIRIDGQAGFAAREVAQPPAEPAPPPPPAPEKQVEPPAAEPEPDAGAAPP